MSNLPMIPLADIQRMAEAVAKSGLFGVKTADQALALMMISQAEGRHPALAARDYDIIQGRPAKKAEAMMRDFLDSGGKVEWHQLDDKAAVATFSHPSGGSVKIDWTMARAVAAGLGGRDMWKKFPRQMLRSRTVSEGIRTVCPMATSGLYVPEEVMDIAKEKNITPTSGAVDNLSQEQVEKLNALAEKAHAWLAQDLVGDALAEIDNAALEADESVYLWTLFDSKQRAAMKKERAAVKAKLLLAPIADPTGEVEQFISDKITDAQKKRLEAVIKSKGITRDDVKAHVKATYGHEHFADLNKQEYKDLDAAIETWPTAEEI